jgi:hypothetical protein
MPIVRREDASEVTELEGSEGRYTEVDEYTIGFETYTADADLKDLLRGLPDDRCQCPHWGYVIEGKLVYHYADGDDVVTAGQAYYARPGHTPELFAGTEVVELSPTEELKKSLEVALRNAEG